MSKEGSLENVPMRESEKGLTRRQMFGMAIATSLVVAESGILTVLSKYEQKIPVRTRGNRFKKLSLHN
ncbi:hypothetical protein A2841_02470 [Candidatus Kaiserbacteria bacterium RIFCSPHIGHO2_01_FULL_48_10]|uniref:Uncharacterized protein n=1 Tax=Candidatus Kaiserbacteria bacterium RIFCSPHIGHO2_01_FULL_48_10 TaxID=1798476 RepID=A0A1F6C2P0_9BACT|nr:MAG: hypothetical protein A2841_02470 [Candidatus Kaiserbacteria bacterium RIFCSPHIGHO2_01_FULL_48_10]